MSGVVGPCGEVEVTPECKPRLSVCVIAYNEAQMLPGMLSTVYGLADQIVVGVDTRTTDATARIAKTYRCEVISVDWRDDFSYARNLTLDAATGDWILVLDADERLTPWGATAVRGVLACAPKVPAPPPHGVTGCAFTIINRSLDGTLLGLQQGSGRLFRNRPEIRYKGIVHEEPWWIPDPDLTCWGLITGAPAILHYGIDESIWVERGKRERNLKLLEKRVAADPTDAYAQERLAATRALSQ